jgi:hypothetical protein
MATHGATVALTDGHHPANLLTPTAAALVLVAWAAAISVVATAFSGHREVR